MNKCDIKAENSSTLCKFHKRTRKGLRPMGSNTHLDFLTIPVPGAIRGADQKDRSSGNKKVF